MYILDLPSKKTEYGCLTGTGRIIATFDNPKRAQEHCDKLDPTGCNWRVVEMTHNYKEHNASRSRALSLVAA